MKQPMTNTLERTTTKKLKHKTQFHFKDIKIFYDLPNQADVYFLTNNHEYNKQVNQMMLDWWYTRARLLPKHWILEVKLWFEYERQGIYHREDEMWLVEKERWDLIRKAPILC